MARVSVPRTPRTATPQLRRQRSARQSFERRQLERHGWRTTLEYLENHQRGPDGRLAQVESEWRAECERVDTHGEVFVVSATAPSVSAVWYRLKKTVDQHEKFSAPDKLQWA